MPLDALPSVGISYSSKADNACRVLRTDFGDGYSQRAADGINSLKESWTLVWEKISSTNYGTLISFFEGKAGYIAFTWTPPGESTSKTWICQKWSKEPAEVNYYNITAELERVFDI